MNEERVIAHRSSSKLGLDVVDGAVGRLEP